MQNCHQPADTVSMAHHLHVRSQLVYILLIVYLMYCFTFTLTLSYRSLDSAEIFFVLNNAVVDGFLRCYTVYFSLKYPTFLFADLKIFDTVVLNLSHLFPKFSFVNETASDVVICCA